MGVSEKSRWWQWSRIQVMNPLIFNVPLAAILFVLYVGGAAAGTIDARHPRAADVVAYVLCFLAAAPLAIRRRYPLGSLAVIAVGVMLYTLFEFPENGLPISVLFALYTVAAWRPWRQSIVALFVVLVFASVAVTWDANAIEIGGILNNLAVFTIAYLFGYSVQARRNYVEQLELRAADLERSRHEEAERAVAEERLRVARELHDVVAHTMSVVAVQSGIAAHVMDQKPEEAKRMLGAISAASRDALEEMRGLLGVLRSDGEAVPAELAPQPTLADLGSLAQSITDAGVPVTLHVDGDRPEMPTGVDVSAYRIVQEALTNVLKHAGSAEAEVNIRYTPEAVAVEIVDDGRGAATGTNGLEGSGGGHGLLGMRERVSVFQGDFAAGPRAGGGFRVAATLPLQ